VVSPVIRLGFPRLGEDYGFWGAPSASALANAFLSAGGEIGVTLEVFRFAFELFRVDFLLGVFAILVGLVPSHSWVATGWNRQDWNRQAAKDAKGGEKKGDVWT
jgi:hypothetical protein